MAGLTNPEYISYFRGCQFTADCCGLTEQRVEELISLKLFLETAANI